MTWKSISNDQGLARNVAQQERQKLEDLRAADGAGKQSEVEASTTSLPRSLNSVFQLK
jgi:hypothetical protein